MKRRSATIAVAAMVAAGVLQSTPARAEGTADLTVSLVASAEPVTANDSLQYTVAVTNNGPDPAARTRIADTIPEDVMLLAVSGKGTYDPLTRSISWHPGSINPGRTIVRTLQIRPIRPGTIIDTADATSLTADPIVPNTAEATSTVDPEPGVHYVSVRGDTGFTPSFHSVPLGETVQWDVFGASTDPPHDITDSHGLGLFDSGPIQPVNFYRFTFEVSGEFRTMDDATTYPNNTGKLVIPVQVSPASGDTATPFTITWALSPLPAAYVEDVQIKRPGSPTWAAWRHGTSIQSDTFVPDAGPGTYAFRDRLRRASTRKASRFGPPVTISVA